MVEPVALRTERLLLRPFALTDVDDVLAYAADEEWGRYLPVARPYTRRDAEEFVAQAVLALWEKEPQFAVVMNARVVGGCRPRLDFWSC